MIFVLTEGRNWCMLVYNARKCKSVTDRCMSARYTCGEIILSEKI